MYMKHCVTSSTDTKVWGYDIAMWLINTDLPNFCCYDDDPSQTKVVTKHILVRVLVTQPVGKAIMTDAAYNILSDKAYVSKLLSFILQCWSRQNTRTTCLYKFSAQTSELKFIRVFC